MIVVKNRVLIVPQDEFNIGTDYDTATETRLFQLERAPGGVDLAGMMFKLDLKYADGTDDTLALDAEVSEDYIKLTWNITKLQLQIPGTVIAQIRALDVDGGLKWTSYTGAFFVEASLFGHGSYEGKLSEIEQFESALQAEQARVANEKARAAAEAERVANENARNAAELARVTAEQARVAAENTRIAAENIRLQNEQEREDWYNSAKANFNAAIASGEKAETIANNLSKQVKDNMDAAAASATAASASATAAAGSANEAKQYSQNWSDLDTRVTKNATDIATVSKKASDNATAINTVNSNLSNVKTDVAQLYSDKVTWYGEITDLNTIVSLSKQNKTVYIGYIDWRQTDILPSGASGGTTIWFATDWCVWAIEGTKKVFTLSQDGKWEKGPYALSADLADFQNNFFINMTNYTFEDLKKVYTGGLPRIGFVGYEGSLTPNKQTGYVLCGGTCALLFSVNGDRYRYSVGIGDTAWVKLN